MNASLPGLVTVAPNGCPQTDVPGTLVPPDGEIALECLELSCHLPCSSANQKLVGDWP